MMRSRFSKPIMPLIGVLLAAVPTNAQRLETFDNGIARIADGLGSPLSGKTVAVFEFPDLEGRVTNLSRLVSEQLTTELVRRLGQAGTVVERRQVIQVLEELNLQKTDLSASDVNRIGRQLGADAIVLGSTTALGQQIVVNARAVAVSGGRVLSADRLSVRGSPELLALATTGLDGPSMTRAAAGRQNDPLAASPTVPTRRMTAAYGPVTVELDRCSRRGSLVRCNLIFTNNGSDGEYSLLTRGAFVGQASRIIDNYGNEYVAGLVHLARKEDDHEVRGTLVSGIPTRGSIDFYQIPMDVTRAAILDVYVGAKPYLVLQFRDVAIAPS